ncbi:hypothetical protein [Amycolatopsis sp. NPDC058986]|uniref:hypothetical protein n=1 Tax=unclassified Amycolatopsis TaxID=2618356 RepID=UPI00366EEDC4
MTTPAWILDLHRLRQVGFLGRRVFGDRARTVTLYYERVWRGIDDVVDVVLVYSPTEAEAYRADSRVDYRDPLSLPPQPIQHPVTEGTVSEIVRTVTQWARPEIWTGYEPG